MTCALPIYVEAYDGAGRRLWCEFIHPEAWSYFLAHPQVPPGGLLEVSRAGQETEIIR